MELYNHMDAISEAKELRLKGIIQKRQEQVILLQLRSSISIDFAAFLKSRDKSIQETLVKSLQETKIKIPSFHEIHLLSPEGRVEVSSSAHYVGTDFSKRESFKHAIKEELCFHDFFYDENKNLAINLAGKLIVEGKDIGVVIIQTSAGDVLSVINDYTGLGETGETTLAKRLPSGKTYYITPTRFFPIPGDSLISPSDSRYAMSIALSGKEIFLTDILDYRDKKVVASTRFIPEMKWGLNTKIDRDEAMAPLQNLLWQTLLLALILIIAVAVLAHFFANHIVRPIVSLSQLTREIANGNLEQRINYSKKNEVGKLAVNFNLMADKLVEANKSLNNKVEELDRINGSLNRFAYVVSHDLKSPLSSISGLITVIRKRLQTHPDPKIQIMLQMTEQKTQHMQDLIAGILQYSSSGVTEEKKESVDLKKLVSEIKENLEVPSHIQVIIEELPIINIERILILQVFQNLIGNAVKYMDKSVGCIKVGQLQNKAFYQFFVSDNGRGIEKRHFEKIFDVFNKTNPIEGIDSSGLGLSIVKRIVETKGGKIWVESEQGNGSTFFFTLPSQ